MAQAPMLTGATATLPYAKQNAKREGIVGGNPRLHRFQFFHRPAALPAASAEVNERQAEQLKAAAVFPKRIFRSGCDFHCRLFQLQFFHRAIKPEAKRNEQQRITQNQPGHQTDEQGRTGFDERVAVIHQQTAKQYDCDDAAGEHGVKNLVNLAFTIRTRRLVAQAPNPKKI
jgi:hypothetical protein